MNFALRLGGLSIVLIALLFTYVVDAHEVLRALRNFSRQKGLGVRERLDAVYAVRPEESALDPELGVLQAKAISAKKW